MPQHASRSLFRSAACSVALLLPKSERVAAFRRPAAVDVGHSVEMPAPVSATSAGGYMGHDKREWANGARAPICRGIDANEGHGKKEEGQEEGDEMEVDDDGAPGPSDMEGGEHDSFTALHFVACCSETMSHSFLASRRFALPLASF